MNEDACNRPSESINNSRVKSKQPYSGSTFIKQLQLHLNLPTEAMSFSDQSLYLVSLTLYSIPQCHWHPGILSLCAGRLRHLSRN